MSQRRNKSNAHADSRQGRWPAGDAPITSTGRPPERQPYTDFDNLDLLGSLAVTQSPYNKSRSQLAEESSEVRSRTKQGVKKVEDTSKRASNSLLPFQRAIVHQIAEDDTLQRLAIRYKIEIPYILRANKLFIHDSIHSRTFLLIPVSGYREELESLEVVDLLKDDLQSYLRPRSSQSQASSSSRIGSAWASKSSALIEEDEDVELEGVTAARSFEQPLDKSKNYLSNVDADISQALADLQVLHQASGFEAQTYNHTRSAFSSSNRLSGQYSRSPTSSSFGAVDDGVGNHSGMLTMTDRPELVMMPGSAASSSGGYGSRYRNIGTRLHDVRWTDPDIDAKAVLEQTSYANIKKSIGSFAQKQVGPALKDFESRMIEFWNGGIPPAGSRADFGDPDSVKQAWQRHQEALARGNVGGQNPGASSGSSSMQSGPTTLSRRGGSAPNSSLSQQTTTFSQRTSYTDSPTASIRAPQTPEKPRKSDLISFEEKSSGTKQPSGFQSNGFAELLAESEDSVLFRSRQPQFRSSPMISPSGPNPKTPTASSPQPPPFCDINASSSSPRPFTTPPSSDSRIGLPSSKVERDPFADLVELAAVKSPPR